MGTAIAMAVLTSLVGFAFGAAAVWLQRYSRRHFAGHASPLPQAKIHDGRGFGRAPVISRNRPAQVMAAFYIVLFWVLAVISVLSAVAALAIGTMSY